MRTRPRPILALALVLALFPLLGAACGSDDGSTVRDASASNNSSGAGGGGSTSGSGSGSGSGSTTEEAELTACSPVGADRESTATETKDIRLVNYAFEPATIDAKVGVVTFKAQNAGTEDHELAFLPGGGDVPLTAGGAPDEDALEAAGAFELEAFGPGQTCNATYELKAGDYTMFCIVEAADGQTHLQKGMKGKLTVK